MTNILLGIIALELLVLMTKIIDTTGVDDD